MARENNNLLIIGAGQYGHVAFEIAQAMGCFGEIAFLDDSYKALAECHPERTLEPKAIEAVEGSLPEIIGTTRDVEKFAGLFRFGFVAIGNPQVRSTLIEKLQSNGFTPTALVHPTAYVSPSARLQDGCCIEPLAVVQAGVVLGLGTFVASGAVVRHNAVVGAFCHVDCNAVVETGAVVPASTKISCNSVFRKERNS